ncbi:thiamine-phosphate kinase [bacterium]|nr:thiamine-phosphate kinase [bacterium]
MATKTRKAAPKPTEASIIEQIRERFTATDQRLLVGIGDDAAVLRTGELADSARRLNSTQQVVTTDLLVEGVHFDLAYSSLADAGYKAVAVNVSDVAAMGATPAQAFGMLGVPSGTTVRQVDELLAGVSEAVQEYGLTLAGGDTVAAPQWILGFTLTGDLVGPALLRSGARPGDIIWHSGSLGLSQTGLYLLSAGEAGKSETDPVRAQLRPRAHVELGRFLQRERLASACLDLSDSLAQCLLQLAEASNVGLSLDFSAYQLAKPVAEFVGSKRGWRAGGPLGFSVPGRYSPAKKSSRFHSPAEYLLASAEDYGLLFTAPPPATARLLSRSSLAVTRLGVVVDKDEGRFYRDQEHRTHELTRIGFEHL